MRTSNSPFRPDIEGLRGVAVLLVVGCHCGISWCVGGFVGVDVFFVLSGYLITRQLATEYLATARIDLPGFFARRARRLLPTSALVIVAVTLVAATILTPQEIELSGRAALAAGLYASNVFFDHTAADYFAPNIDRNPLLHTWSLGLEEQFYLAWPLLIPWVATRGTGPTRGPLWILGGITAASLVCSVYATHVAPTIAFYELPARAWEFAAGGLLAFLTTERPSTNNSRAVVCGIVGITLILGTAILVKGGAGFPGWIALFPVAGTFAIIFAGAGAPGRGISSVLDAAPLQFLGARSYSWYLWHWPVIVFSAILFPDISMAGKITAAAVSLLLATLTFRFVERPVRESARLSSRSALSLGLCAGASALVVGVAYLSLNFGRQQLAQDERFQRIAAASADVGDLPHHCFSEGLSFAVRMCQFGARDATQSIVLFGDSHAMQWFYPLRTAATLEGWRLITFVRPGCAASDINPHNLSVADDHCKQWRGHAIDSIIALHPSAIVMASYNGATLRGDFLTPTLMPVEEVRLGTRHTLERLARADTPIVVLRDTPLPPSNIPTCIARHEGDGPHSRDSCDFDATTALNAAAFSAEQAAADGLRNIHFIDMNDLMCGHASCYAAKTEMIVYRDADHLTATFAESMAPQLRERLFQVLESPRQPAAVLESLQRPIRRLEDTTPLR